MDLCGFLGGTARWTPGAVLPAGPLVPFSPPGPFGSDSTGVLRVFVCDSSPFAPFPTHPPPSLSAFRLVRLMGDNTVYGTIYTGDDHN